MGDHFCLKWNNHQENLTGIMAKLLEENKFVDVTLVCDNGTSLKAHRTVLSASSAYFEKILEEHQHPQPMVILKDVRERDLTALLQYMYKGEVNVRDDELPAFLQTARALKVRGLSESKKEPTPLPQDDNVSGSFSETDTISSPKRARISVRFLEQEVSDSQSPIPSTSGCTSSLRRCANFPAPSGMNYSDSSRASTPTQTIKEEVGSTPAQIQEERSEIADMQGNLESRAEHGLGEWSYEYGHSLESRNYQAQQVELPKVPIPMTYTFSSHLQGTSMPGLYPCNAKGKVKKDQPGTSYEPKPKGDFPPGPSFAPGQPLPAMKAADAPESAPPGGIQRKGGRFRPGWMENYSWLQYDECLNTMYCKTCRKWSSSVPDIRTSFVEGNGNFRLEIVNHHHKSKAHRLCMAKEEESIPRLDPIVSEDNH